jgi:hypothetical protein
MPGPPLRRQNSGRRPQMRTPVDAPSNVTRATPVAPASTRHRPPGHRFRWSEFQPPPLIVQVVVRVEEQRCTRQFEGLSWQPQQSSPLGLPQRPCPGTAEARWHGGGWHGGWHGYGGWGFAIGFGAPYQGGYYGGPYYAYGGDCVMRRRWVINRWGVLRWTRACY